MSFYSSFKTIFWMITFSIYFVFIFKMETQWKNDVSSDRGGSRTPTASKTELTVTLVNSWKLLINVTKKSIIDAWRVLDTPPSGVNMTSKWLYKRSRDAMQFWKILVWKKPTNFFSQALVFISNWLQRDLNPQSVSS